MRQELARLQQSVEAGREIKAKEEKVDLMRVIIGFSMGGVGILISLIVGNLISKSIGTERTNELMLAYLAIILIDLFILQLLNGLMQCLLIFHLGKGKKAGGSNRQCLMGYISYNLINILR